MERNKKPIFGVGINDSEDAITLYDEIDGKEKQVWKCPYYAKWKGLMERCYCPKYHIKKPSYIGCSVCDEWIYFSNFKRWMKTQDWEGKQLDKDILEKGNKIYSPETCIFIPSALNTFLTDSAKTRGIYKIGVNLYKPSGKYRAACNNPFIGKQEHIGLYPTEEEAHQAWKTRKHQHALTYAELQTDSRIAEALRQLYI